MQASVRRCDPSPLVSRAQSTVWSERNSKSLLSLTSACGVPARSVAQQILASVLSAGIFGAYVRYRRDKKDLTR